MKMNGWDVERLHNKFTKTRSCVLSSMSVSEVSFDQVVVRAGRPGPRFARRPKQTSVLSIMILALSVACLMGCSGITSARNNAPPQANSLQIETATLPSGTVNTTYSASLAAAGGFPPYTWQAVGAGLPTGLTLIATTGVISGTPAQAGSFAFMAQVQDSHSDAYSRSVAVSIAAAISPLQLTTTSLPVGTINANYSATLTATGGTPPYSWSTTAGQLPPAVALSAATGVIGGRPSQAGTFSFTAQVTDSKAANASAGLSLNISTAAAPTITTVSPNTGTTAGGTSVTISGSGFQAGATVQFGNTPAASGQVTTSTQIQAVTPTEAAGSVNVSVTNTDGQVATDANAFAFSGPSPGGPLLPTPPQATVDTAFPNTAGYTVTNVTPGQLQAAINGASCNPSGTILQLPAGSVDSEAITLPLKSCAPGQWIIITTSGVTIPSQGTRIDPSVYDGQLAKITNSATNTPTVQTAQNSPVNHYWLSGLEIEQAGFLQDAVINIGGTTIVPTNFPSYIVVDRCYVHGRATTNTARDISINGSNIGVVDSYISEGHEVGFDAQAISAFSAPGPILIQNNFLEGSGENVLFGGAGLATNNPPYNVFVYDATFRGNFFYKPLAWRISDPSYMGIHWTVKNLLELKEGARILAENNVLENNWGDAQTGTPVLFTPTQQSGVNTVLQDVTFRNNTILHTPSGFSATGRDATDSADTMHRTDRVLVQNNLFDDMNQSKWSGTGNFFIVMLGVNGLTVDHNTVSRVDNALAFVNNDLPETAFSFTNNIGASGQYGLFVNASGTNSVATLDQWLGGGGVLPTISYNVVAGLPLSVCSVFFTSTQCPSSLSNVGFVNYNSGSGGDYRLCSGSGTPSASCGGASPYAAGQKNSCASNTDCGANVAQLQQMESQAAIFPSTVPTISFLSATSMVCNGSNPLTITGTNLNLPGTDVVINGTPVVPKSQPTLVSIVVVPPGARGVTVPVTVDNFGLPVTVSLTCQ